MALGVTTVLPPHYDLSRIEAAACNGRLKVGWADASGRWLLFGLGAGASG